MVYYYPKMADLAPQQITYINNYISDFETALFGSNYDDPVEGYRKFIDVSTFIDYFIINEVTKNLDGFKKSRYFHKDKDHADGTFRKLKAGPVWDFDWSQKDFDGQSAVGFMYDDLFGQDVNAPAWYTRLLEDPIFRNQLRCRYEDFRRTILSEESIHQKLDSVASYLDESKTWHFVTWGNESESNATPSTTFEEEITWLKNWYSDRLVWLDANMPGTLDGCSMTGVEELTVNGVEIENYPNPFNSYITIYLKSGLNGHCTVRLLDQMGRIVKDHKVNLSEFQSNLYTLKDLEGLKGGIYFLEIEINDQKFVKKMMK